MAEGNKIKLTLTDLAGSKTASAEIPSNVSISRLIPVLVEKMGLPADVLYHVYHKQSGRQLQPNDTLSSVGVKESDTLRLQINEEHMDNRETMRTFKNIQFFDAVASGRIAEQDSRLTLQKRPHLFGVFLYTDQHAVLASYIRTHLAELKEAGGDKFLFFVAEKFVINLPSTLRNQIGDLFDSFAEKVWERLGVKSTRPYPLSDIEYAFQPFGLGQLNQPYIMVFSNLSEKDVLFIPMNQFAPSHTEQEYLGFFHLLFAQIEIAVLQADPLIFLGKSLVGFKKSAGATNSKRLINFNGSPTKLSLTVESAVAQIIKTIG